MPRGQTLQSGRAGAHSAQGGVRPVDLLVPGIAPATPMRVPPPGGDLADFGLTLAECLQIPPLTRARLCGGAAGLQRRARWVHVVDHDDIEDCLPGNELILTSGVSLARNPGLQRAIFPIMERRACAGLVLSLGAYMPDLPDAMIDAADQYGIPLLTMPWEVNFRDITQVLLTRIVRTQYQLLEDAERISRSLLQLALNRGTLECLCARLAEVTGRPVAVLGPQFDIVAADPAARKASRFPAMFQPQPGQRPAPQKTQTMENAFGQMILLAPVYVTSRLQAYLAIGTGADQPNRFEAMTLDAATLVCALLMTQSEELDRMRASRARDAFEALLDGTQDPGRIAALGPLPAGPYSVAVLEVEGGATVGARRLVRQGLEGLASHVRLTEYGDCFVLLLASLRKRSARSVAGMVQQAVAGSRIGLSRPFASLSTIRAAYEEAGDAVAMGRLAGSAGSVSLAEDGQALLPFWRAIQQDPLAACPRITVLAAHDAAHASELVRTLEIFLNANQNAASAARALGIHRHTLGYRLNRIGELLGTVLTPSLTLDLRLQLLAHRCARRRGLGGSTDCP